MVLEMLATLSVALIAASIGLCAWSSATWSSNRASWRLILAPEVYLPLRMVGMQFHAAEDGLAAADTAFAVIDEAPARREAGTGSEVPADNSVDAGRPSACTRRYGLAPHRLDVSCRAREQVDGAGPVPTAPGNPRRCR
ncbi:hypothetical protein GS451_07950 [Rhodococcus hoagii]|nr:hypothetical protein [Prescottella equi]